MKILQKGFTLIELMIVVAIIGILASVVLASLNTARDKGADAAIKANVNGIRAQAELYYDSNGNTYAGTAYTVQACLTAAQTGNMFADANVMSALNASATQSGAGLSRCAAAANSWVIAFQLKTGGTAGDTTADAYCVDSTGQATSYAYGTSETIANAVTSGACT
mgnify:CR=1 FL=1